MAPASPLLLQASSALSWDPTTDSPWRSKETNHMAKTGVQTLPHKRPLPKHSSSPGASFSSLRHGVGSSESVFQVPRTHTPSQAQLCIQVSQPFAAFPRLPSCSQRWGGLCWMDREPAMPKGGHHLAWARVKFSKECPLETTPHISSFVLQLAQVQGHHPVLCWVAVEHAVLGLRGQQTWV